MGIVNWETEKLNKKPIRLGGSLLVPRLWGTLREIRPAQITGLFSFDRVSLFVRVCETYVYVVHYLYCQGLIQGYSQAGQGCPRWAKLPQCTI